MKKLISTLIAVSIFGASIISPVQAASFGRSSPPSPSRPTNTTKPVAPPVQQQSNFSQNQSWGMQRPQVTQQVQTKPATQPVAPTPTPVPTANKPSSTSSISPTTAGLIGVGTGLLLGTAVGSAMATPTAQPQVQQPAMAPAQSVTVPNPYGTALTLPTPTVQPQIVQPAPAYQPIVPQQPQAPVTIKSGWASFWDGVFGLIWFVIILALAVIGWIFYRNRSKVKSVKDAKDIMVHEFSNTDTSKPVWKPESKLASVALPFETSLDRKIADSGVDRSKYAPKKNAHDIALDIFIKIQTAFNQCDRVTLEQYVSSDGYHLFEGINQFDYDPSIKLPHINITCEIQDDGSESGIISAWFTAFDSVTGIPVNEIWHIKDGKLAGVTQV